jgi:orotidine-5'-phosphate decarboxylase
VTARFGARLRAAVDSLGPLCVGIDPHPSLLASWGLSDDVKGLETFSRTVGEALGAGSPRSSPSPPFMSVSAPGA